MRKSIKLETIQKAVRETRSRGIRTNGFFIVGFPWETKKQVQATVDFALELDLDMVNLFSATPLPGTELWELAASQQELPKDVGLGLSDFRTPQLNMTKMPAQDYVDIFSHAKERISAYNNRRVFERYRATWPGAM